MSKKLSASLLILGLSFLLAALASVLENDHGETSPSIERHLAS